MCVELRLARQKLADFLNQHEQLCTWDGLAAEVSKMLNCKTLPSQGRDSYGYLGGLLHRAALEQQLLDSDSNSDSGNSRSIPVALLGQIPTFQSSKFQTPIPNSKFQVENLQTRLGLHSPCFPYAALRLHMVPVPSRNH